MQPITNPRVPHLGPLNGGFHEGTILRIQGHVSATADRFNINLHCGPPPSDVALHLSVRLLQNYIARNSLEAGEWGNEEGEGSLPISPDQGFEILIFCDRPCFKIAINGNHFCEFKHRLPFKQVNFLEVDGDVTLRLISLEEGSSAPPPPMGGPPDYSANYDRPPNQYGPSGPYDSSRGGPARPPGYEEESGFDTFLESAGTVIAGALASGVAQNLLTNLTGGGGQTPQQQAPRQQQYQPPPPPPPHPQQPLFQLGGEGSLGGLGSVGSLFQSFASDLLKPQTPRREYTSTTMPLLNQPPPFNMPQPTSMGMQPHQMPMLPQGPLHPPNMPMPSYGPLQPPNMPLPSHGSLNPPNMPLPSHGSLHPPNMPMPMHVPIPSATMPIPTSVALHSQPHHILMPISGGYPTQPYSQPIPSTLSYGQPTPYMSNPYVPYNKKADKKMKKKLKKAAKYGIPIAAAGVGAYALSRALHHSSSSSSSSSDSD